MLQDFEIQIGTDFVFGRQSIDQIGDKLQTMNVHHVLLHHDGGPFLQSTGLLDRVRAQFKQAGIAVTELAGVQPNPRLSLVREGIAIVKAQKIDLIFAIGGGSTIDSAKAIGLGAATDRDVWDFFTGQATPTATVKVASLVTYPAAGSESSAVTVVNNTAVGQKLLVSDPIVRPAVAFMAPELTSTLPPFLTACGIVDMFCHVCERYFSPDNEIGVVDRMAEGILRTIVDLGPKVLAHPADYESRAELMWIATIAQNNTVGMGRTQDWATHEIANELSAVFDTPHGATIAIIMGSWMAYASRQKPYRFARFAREVCHVPAAGKNDQELANEGIKQVVAFFKQLGMPTSFADYDVPTTETERMLGNIAFRGDDQCIGGIVRLNREDCRRIYQSAFDGQLF
ncbi:iron-containing alcohol dehydrogenase [Levilactobacillus huananensis]|uniref:iron-containing alcohol dehydrogenase n=1 Tax=Levilactobacillus huananensis TaxID=2486019 RepID=UPI000F796CF9|nr:iron-containing alcohol dehydrogenase [Levilactobacillus huananensis]